MATAVTADDVRTALGRVIDPELRRPITDLDMVEDVQVSDGTVSVSILLTTPGCPLRDTIAADVREAVGELEGVMRVNVRMGAMNDEQRAALQNKLRGGQAGRVIPFAQPDNLTRVYAIASGKGGVGKSSVTANLAASMAARGMKVGLVDADIFGFSIPRMMGVEYPPSQLDNMIIPPVAHGVKIISIGMFLPDNSAVVWRGPILHKALEQFLADVFWGDLDVLLLDLPPGTGDIAISVAQLIPDSELVIVTTPQAVSAEVAERAGQMAPFRAGGSAGRASRRGRSCRTWPCPTGRETRSSGEAEASRSRTSSPRGSAGGSPCSERCPSNPPCAWAATTASP